MVGGMMLNSSRPLTVLDYFRVPYQASSDQVPPLASGERALLGRLVSAAGGTAALYWPELSEDALLSTQALQPRLIRLGSLWLAARVLPTDACSATLTRPAVAVVGKRPSPSPIPEANLCQRSSGMNAAASRSRSIPTRSCGPSGPRVTERKPPAGYGYGLGASRVLQDASVAASTLQIALRRAYAPIQARSRFPAWPLEESLHGFYDAVLGWVAEVARVPVPWIAPWPHGHAWALVLTHDVETVEGLRQMPVLAEVEERRGYVSSWNFVPKRYEVPESVLTDLASRGCEVGIHGLYHDGRDLESPHVAGAPTRNGPLCPTVGGCRLPVTCYPARLGSHCRLAV